MRARIFGLHAEDSSLGVRKVARQIEAETGVQVSRETVRKLLRSAREADRPIVGMPIAGAEPPWPVALSAVRPMTEEDHKRFDRYRGAVCESPAVWWTGR